MFCKTAVKRYRKAVLPQLANERSPACCITSQCTKDANLNQLIDLKCSDQTNQNFDTIKLADFSTCPIEIEKRNGFKRSLHSTSSHWNCTQLQASCYSSQGLDLLHLWNIPTNCINQDTDGPWYQTQD